MSEVSPRFDVSAADKVWAVVPPRQKDKAEFVRWLKQQARKEVIDAKDDLPVEDYQGQLREIFLSSAAGRFAWDGGICQEALRNRPGRLQMLLLILLRNHPTLTADEPDENPAEALYDENPADFNAALDAVLTPVPNSTPPANPGEKTPTG